MHALPERLPESAPAAELPPSDVLFWCLQECLDLYTQTELLGEYMCEACKRKKCGDCKTREHRLEGASKQLLMYRLPLVLVLQLKRFSYGVRACKKVLLVMQTKQTLMSA